MSSKAGFACLCMVMSSLIISLQVWVKLVLFRSQYHASISTKSIGFMSLVLRSEKERCKTKFYPWTHNKKMKPSFQLVSVLKWLWSFYLKDFKGFPSYAQMRFQTPHPLLISWIEIWSFASRTFLPNIPEQRNFIICIKFLQKFSCEIKFFW